MWSSIRGLVAGGTTVLLTTQYLDEADQLADRVVVIDTGRTIAEGPPDDLKAQIGGDRLDVVVAGDDDVAMAACLVARAAGAEPDVDREARRLSVPVDDRVAALTNVLQVLAGDGIEVVDVGIRRPDARRRVPRPHRSQGGGVMSRGCAGPSATAGSSPCATCSSGCASRR